LALIQLHGEQGFGLSAETLKGCGNENRRAKAYEIQEK
jgi:hypothetical protein